MTLVSARSVSAQVYRSKSISGAEAFFYPGLEPGQRRSGTASTFDQARVGFEAAWADLLSAIPAGALDEYRRDREHRAEIRAIQARGEKLPTELPHSLMRCTCGVTFDTMYPRIIWCTPLTSTPHRRKEFTGEQIR
jgi:hypothetical protein